MTISDLVNQIESKFKEIEYSIINGNVILFFTKNGLPFAELTFEDSHVTFFEYKNKLSFRQDRRVAYIPKNN